MDLKDQIRIAREALGINLDEFAEKMQVSKQAVIFWEMGKGPKLSRIKDIEAVLKTKFNVSGNKSANEYADEITAEDKEFLVSVNKLTKIQKDTIKLLVGMISNSRKQIPSFFESNSVIGNKKVESFFETNSTSSLGKKTKSK